MCGAEAAEDKAAQEFKQRTEAGAGASDVGSVEEQVPFVMLAIRLLLHHSSCFRAVQFRQSCEFRTMAWLCTESLMVWA